ncbi:MAG: redoxin domain-containing protein [Phycisphaerales bacterium]
MPHVRNLTGACLASLIALAWGGTAGAQLLDNLKQDSLVLTNQELSWIDQRLTAEERALLDTTRGAAPPAFGENAEFVGTDPIKWEDLRGRVVVIQSWSSATSEGRPLPRRIDRILEQFDPNDVVPIFVHTPEGADTAAAFIERLGATDPIVIDKRGRFLDEMGIFRRPVISVIDRSGAVRYAGLSIATLDEALRKLIAEPFDPEAPAPKPMKPRDERVVAVVGPDTSGLNDRAVGYPRVDKNNAPAGKDMREQELPEFDPTKFGLVQNAPGMDEGPRVTLYVLTHPTNLSMDLINQYNRWALRQSDTVVILGVIADTDRVTAAWRNTTNIQWGLLSNPEKTLMKDLQITERELPYAYLTSPDGVVRWQGRARDVSQALIDQIARASGVKSDAPAGGGSGPRAVDLPRWRDIVR